MYINPCRQCTYMHTFHSYLFQSHMLILMVLSQSPLHSLRIGISNDFQLKKTTQIYNTIVQCAYACSYRRSGNFCVKKLSYDKFSCKKNFVLTALALIVRTNFHKINFRSCHRLRKYSYNENFQIYGIHVGDFMDFVNAYA